MSARNMGTDHKAGGRWLWAAQAILLLFTAYVLVFDICRAPINLEWQDRGAWGGRLDGSQPAQGFVTVRAIFPGLTLDKAGIKPGDKLRFAHAYDAVRYPTPGDQVTVTVDRNGQKRPVVLQVVHGLRTTSSNGNAALVLNQASLVDMYFSTFAVFVMILTGGLMIWRGRGELAILLLGASLVSQAIQGPTAPQQFPAALFPVFETLDVFGLAAFPPLLYGFALCFYREQVGPLGRITKAVFWAYVAGQCAFEAVVLYRLFKDGWNPGFTNIFGPLSYAALAAAMVYLILGWRRSALEIRQRYALLVFATGVGLVDQAIQMASTGMPLSVFGHTAIHALSTALEIVGAVLYPYAIFRQKVFDLGFAVNRTLVYGVVSAVLLVAFGLIEWASEHFIPIEAREKNVLVDAGIALGVFLTFHRLRDWVEEFIERLFFHHWHEREAALRRFVAEAAFITRPEVLTSAFVQALTHFAEGAEATLYLRTEGEDAEVYRTTANAAVAATMDVNDPTVVRLRHDRAVAAPPPGSRLADAALVLPMLHRNELIGFVALAPKPEGLDYRPDEKTQLGWAAHQIGLDLHALRVEQLEGEVRALQYQVQAQSLAFKDAISGRTAALA